MARSKTLLQMRTRVRRLTDLRTSQFMTDSEIDEEINAALTHVWDKLASAGGERYCENPTPQSITTVAGTPTYALPSDYFKTSRLVVVLDGREYGLDRFGDREIDGTRPVNRVWSLKHYYVPPATVLVGDAATFDGINGWEEMACVHAAIAIKQVAEEDVSTLMALYAIEKERLEKLRSPRSKQGPFRMPDVLNGPRYWWESVVASQSEVPQFQLTQAHIELREGFA